MFHLYCTLLEGSLCAFSVIKPATALACDAISLDQVLLMESQELVFPHGFYA